MVPTLQVGKLSLRGDRRWPRATHLVSGAGEIDPGL